MRLARWLTVLFFVVTAVCFTWYTLKDNKQTDVVPPVISCDSDTLEASVNADDAELLAGVTAIDDKDGNVSDSLVVVSKSKFMEKGKLRIHYAAFDSHGNAATYSRILIYTDYVSPHFSISEPLRFSVNTWNYTLLDKVSVEDYLDGDISGLIKYKFGGDGPYYGVEGKMSVTFQVTNSAGDTVQLPVSVEVLSEQDYAMPYPELTEYLVYTKVNQRLDPKDYLIGVLEGNREYPFGDAYGSPYSSENVAIVDQVDYATPGVYEIIYTLKSQDGSGSMVKQGSVTLYVVVEE